MQLFESSEKLLQPHQKPWFYLAPPEFCHHIFFKSAKFTLSPKSNDKLQISLGIQIYSSNGCYFWWNQNWLNFFTIKRSVPQCGLLTTWRTLMRLFSEIQSYGERQGQSHPPVTTSASDLYSGLFTNILLHLKSWTFFLVSSLISFVYMIIF